MKGVLPGEPFRERKVSSASIVLLQDLTPRPYIVLSDMLEFHREMD